MHKIFLTFLIFISINYADSITVEYLYSIASVKSALFSSASNCRFVIDDSAGVFKVRNHYQDCWTNIRLMGIDSMQTRVSLTSFCETPETQYSKSKVKESKDFKRTIFEAMDQELLKDKSSYFGVPFKAKNQNIFTITTIITPGIGMFYLFDSPIYPKTTKYVSSVFLALDAFGIWGISNPNIQLAYRKEWESKPNNYGYYLGGFMLILMRLICLGGVTDYFNYQYDIQNSKYFFTYDINVAKHKKN